MSFSKLPHSLTVQYNCKSISKAFCSLHSQCLYFQNFRDWKLKTLFMFLFRSSSCCEAAIGINGLHRLIWRFMHVRRACCLKYSSVIRHNYYGKRCSEFSVKNLTYSFQCEPLYLSLTGPVASIQMLCFRAIESHLSEDQYTWLASEINPVFMKGKTT